ncbi:MAG: hypothetical protein IPH11_04315 [Ignavibacteriales bacterium]|nr:hypothetical protein [Ignavibacteriales bacterium]
MKTVKLTTNRKVTPETSKPITGEFIRTIIGCLEMKGKRLLKVLMEGKKIERIV